jgi:hypothetical protein
MKRQDMKNSKKRYVLIPQVHDNKLYRRIMKKHKNENGEIVLSEINKMVLYYELLFDIIHETHMHLGHPRDVRSHKTHIDNLWWGCTEDSINICVPNAYVRRKCHTQRKYSSCNSCPLRQLDPMLS